MNTHYTTWLFLLFISCNQHETHTPTPSQTNLPAPQDRTELPHYSAQHVAIGSIEIDGFARENAWENAAISDAFVSTGDGSYNADSQVNARTQLLWNEEALFVFLHVEDENPTSPYEKMDIDPHVWAAASGIELMLQPGDLGDNLDYYELQIGVEEEVWDTHFDDYNQPITGEGEAREFGLQSWNSQVERSVKIEEGNGYFIEFRIPWNSFLPSRVAIPPAPNDIWRMNLYSFKNGQRQALAWSPLLGEGNFHRTSRFGYLHFNPESLHNPAE